MKTASISDVTQQDFDNESQVMISGIKSSDPKLDTRVGTVLRSLIVNPAARIASVLKRQIEYVRRASSLKTISEDASGTDDVDIEDVNALMSNFNLTSQSGTYADGLVKISVVDGNRQYSVLQNIVFRTIEGLEFQATKTVTAKSVKGAIDGKTVQNAFTSDTVSIDTPLYQGASSFFFLVPVRAVETGARYNIPQGTSLEPSSSMFSFISAEAYKSFDGGTDIDDLQQVISRIPAGLSLRGFVNKNSCEGMLRSEFDGGQYPIIACSTVGYTDSEQRRDKHHLFGVGVGGRIDLYVRNFGDVFTLPGTVVGHREYVRDGSGEVVSVNYRITVDNTVFPGAAWIKDVSSIYDVNSPLDFECRRVAYGVNSTWHDFDVKDNPSEIFNTVWQGFEILAKEVPADINNSNSSSSDDEWSETRYFKVTAYCLPEITKLQEFVDRDDIRNVSTDVVVRCPILCNVTVSAAVVYDSAKPMDAEDAKYRIRKYINSLGFTDALTRSEIVHELKKCGAVSVDLNDKDMLFGVLHDAYGKEYNISGDALRLDNLSSPDAMVSSKTTIFVAEPENIQLTLIPNK